LPVLTEPAGSPVTSATPVRSIPVFASRISAPVPAPAASARIVSPWPRRSRDRPRGRGVGCGAAGGLHGRGAAAQPDFRARDQQVAARACPRQRHPASGGQDRVYPGADRAHGGGSAQAGEPRHPRAA
jgi:hypothetical protein